MSLRRTSRSVDGTIPISALLYTDEEIYASQDNVGIYEGTQKSPKHQAGTVFVSTHRLFYIDSQNAYKHSFALDLSSIIQTDHYAGLFKSSPKVTLYVTIAAGSSGQPTTSAGEGDGFESWECEVCGYRNPPGLSPAAAAICGLCGVPRASVPSSSSHRSDSLPSSAPSSTMALLSLSSPPSTESDSNACTACTFLNHPSLRYCEMCSTELPRHSPKLSRINKSAPSSRPPSPDPDDDNDPTSPHFIKISFRKDLEALMIKAKDMVRLAAELNEKLTAISAVPETQLLSSSIAPPEPEEATFIRSSLSQLGLQMPNAPVTLDMMKDEKKWIEQLAKELAQVLQGSVSVPRTNQEAGGMMKKRGIIALDEVWGGWNRARGVALIPPSTFLLVLPLLPIVTDPPIQTRAFASGLKVLHTPMFTHAAFSARLSGLLALTGPKTVTQVAQEESITLGLAEEMIEAVEGDGDICRDESSSNAIVGGGEVRWWANLFVGYTWDGQI
ncbi:hypothetical protein H0H93_014880 [Arthromyces matolae]|nr:hypothetical protein H0H93_014880 [Arthromyces matolae]